MILRRRLRHLEGKFFQSLVLSAYKLAQERKLEMRQPYCSPSFPCNDNGYPSVVQFQLWSVLATISVISIDSCGVKEIVTERQASLLGLLFA